jgi:hypothetical protein
VRRQNSTRANCGRRDAEKRTAAYGFSRLLRLVFRIDCQSTGLRRQRAYPWLWLDFSSLPPMTAALRDDFKFE